MSNTPNTLVHIACLVAISSIDMGLVYGDPIGVSVASRV